MEAIGAVNNYACDGCSSIIVTINLNAGTTPFGIKCPKCGGTNAFSTFYKLLKTSPVTHAWYRPNKEELLEFEKEQPGWIDHVLGGGLKLKELKDEVNEDWTLEQWNNFARENYPGLSSRGLELINELEKKDAVV